MQLTVPEAAKLLHVSEDIVYQCGRVKGVRTLILSSACPGGEAIELFQDARRFRESNPPNHMADHE